MGKSEDIIQHYSKKYNFHNLLISLLESTETERKEFISKNPIVKNEIFITYLQNHRQEIKENLEKIPNFSNDITSIVLERFDLIKQTILSSKRIPEKRPPKTTTSFSTSQQQCGICAGQGKITCSSCTGYGYHSRSSTRTSWDGSTEYVEENIPCSSCIGGKQNCWKCGGSGVLYE